MDEPLPTAPTGVVDSSGAIPFGTYRGRLEQIDWAPLCPGPVWRLRRWKHWHYVSIAGPGTVLAVAVVDVGWAGSAFAYLFDRTTRRLVADVDAMARPGRATVSAEPGPTARTTFSSPRLSVRLTGEAGTWRLEARSAALTVDATLEETDAGPTLCALARVPGGVADCTHKTPALRVDGVAGVGGALHDLGGCIGALDHTSGLLAHDTRWRWASATDERVALNLTEGFTAPYENVLWVDGELRALPPVVFSFDSTAPDSPWSIASGDGDVDLEFRPEGRRQRRTRLLVAESSYLQPIGTFHGTIGGIAVDGLTGVTEDHVARW